LSIGSLSRDPDPDPDPDDALVRVRVGAAAALSGKRTSSRRSGAPPATEINATF
jgi:hypothetical protein